METGGSLTAPESVRKLQTALHAKAKESPDSRFYALSDKVWRADFLQAAWHAVRRNGGAAGVDGETVERIEERWLGELARDMKEGTYRPSAVRQVLIPKKQAGKYRPLGIPCVRDRVAQTAALMVLTPISETNLQPEQYAYRKGRFDAEIVNFADDLVACGKAPAATMREVVEAMMERLRVPVNAAKTRSMRAAEEPLEFLGYRIGRNYRPTTGSAYIGTRPSRSSVVERVPQDQRVDATEIRTTGLESRGKAPESSDGRVGKLPPTGTGQSGLPGGGRACDPAATPVAVPQAQGTGRDVSALLG